MEGVVRIKNRLEPLNYVVLLIAVLVKASEKIHALIASKQPFNACNSIFWELSCKKHPITVLNLQKSG